MSTGRELDLHMDLLDRQIVDRDGRLCGKVDDLELSTTEDGTVYVSALLTGPIALAPRLGRRLGKWLTDLARHAAGDLERPPFRIDVRHVVEMAQEITLDSRSSDLDLAQGEVWIADKIIGRLPGASHASE